MRALVFNLGGTVQYFDRDGRQAYLLSWPQRSILVFRGTQGSDPRDVLDDLKLDTVTFRNTRVHRGFMRRPQNCGKHFH